MDNEVKMKMIVILCSNAIELFY